MKIKSFFGEIYAKITPILNKSITKIRKLYSRKWVRVTSIAVGALIVACASVAIAWNIIVRPPALPTVPSPDPAGQIVTKPPLLLSAQPSSTADPWAARGVREGCYTVLLAGVDYGESPRTDVMMVATFDTKNRRVDVINVPRDLVVNVKRASRKINAAYQVGGVEQLKDELSTLLGFRPDFHVIVNMQGFADIIDTIGGMEYNVPYNINKKTDDMHLRVPKGLQTLDGAHALMFVRYRGMGDDLDRISNQQKFLKAVAYQVIDWHNLSKINEIVRISTDSLSTDLQYENLLWFAQELSKLDTEAINFHTYPILRGKDVAYIYADEPNALKLINETVNPLRRDITADDLNIVIEEK